jgi:hypothetical protein
MRFIFRIMDDLRDDLDVLVGGKLLVVPLG